MGNFLDIDLSGDFLDLTPKHKKIKSKQVGLQTKKLLHTKINDQQNEMAIYAMGKKVTSVTNHQGTASQNHNEIPPHTS